MFDARLFPDGGTCRPCLSARRECSLAWKPEFAVTDDGRVIKAESVEDLPAVGPDFNLASRLSLPPVERDPASRRRVRASGFDLLECSADWSTGV